METKKANETKTTQNRVQTIEPKIDLAKELEIAKKQIEELQKAQSLPKTLEERMEYFAKMQELSNRITILDKNVGVLKTYLEEIDTYNKVADFGESKVVKVIVKGHGYDNSIEVTNQSIVADFIDYLISKLEAKKTEFKTEISK